MIPNEEKIKAIINKWHSYDGCEENYHSQEEVVENSHKYRMLRTCAIMQGIKVEDVISFMLGEAA